MCISRGCVVPVHKFVLFGKCHVFVRWYQTRFPGVEVEGTLELYFFQCYMLQIFCPHNNYMCVLDAAYLEGLPGALFV
jgi:hypothetical protein